MAPLLDRILPKILSVCFFFFQTDIYDGIDRSSCVTAIVNLYEKPYRIKTVRKKLDDCSPIEIANKNTNL